MRARSHAREADGGRKAISEPRDPAMMVISASYDGSYRKHSCCVARWKAAALERRFSSIEKCVVKGSARRNIRRPLSASHRLDGQINHRAVGICLACEQGRADLVGVVPEVTSHHKRRWHRNYFSRSDGSIEDVIYVVQVPLVMAEVWHCVWIGENKPRRYPSYCEGGGPMMSFRKLARKSPNPFLVVEKVTRQASPRSLSLGW